jgi:hypothetical protein
MTHLRGYDAWKTRAPDHSGGGVGLDLDRRHEKMLWFRSWRLVKRQGQAQADAWLDEQRAIPRFAHYVKEADAHNARWRDR